MIPRQPPRRPQLGFVYVPPFRVQGLSIAGEETSIQIPELDVCFDIGLAPKAVLSSNYVALSHGHMDHSAGLAYYFSQRHFQGMGTGTVACPPELEGPINGVMKAWVELEGQRTPYNIVPMAHEQELEIKNNIFLRAFRTKHTAASNGYVVVERRSKLKPEYAGLPQEQLVELKKQGSQITMTLESPLVAYTGDTMMGDHLLREDVLSAKVLICECTFTEPGHRGKAGIGQHMHLDDVVELLKQSRCDAMVLVHMSRRTHMEQARRCIVDALPESDKDRVLLLMDSRNNRDRYDRQRQAAEEAAASRD